MDPSLYRKQFVVAPPGYPQQIPQTGYYHYYPPPNTTPPPPPTSNSTLGLDDSNRFRANSEPQRFPLPPVGGVVKQSGSLLPQPYPANPATTLYPAVANSTSRTDRPNSPQPQHVPTNLPSARPPTARQTFSFPGTNPTPRAEVTSKQQPQQRALATTSNTNANVNNAIAAKLPVALADEIHKFRMEGFAKQFFGKQRRGVLGIRRMPVQMLLRYSPEPITKSLLKLQNPAHNKNAIRSFKLIQKFMSDEVNTELASGVHTAREFISIGLACEYLRDEMFCQVCKQTNGNPDTTSSLKGWQLLLILIESYLPTKNLENYVRKYLYDSVSTNTVASIQTFAYYCFKRFGVLTKANRRARLPTDGEIRRSRIAPFQPTPFGVTLTEIMTQDGRGNIMISKEDPKLPAILTFLATTVIELGGCETEGIFRISADVDACFELRLQLENGIYDRSTTKTRDPHVYANVLKMWLGELEDPLIPHTLYDSFIAANGDIDKLTDLVYNRLPEVNRNVLFYILKYLHRIAAPQNQPKTKMPVSNLAVIFSPNMFRCPYDNAMTIMENTKIESEITLDLIRSLPIPS